MVGPGPGSPLIDSDIGIIKDLWRIPQEFLIPIFGVCLGLQSLAVEHGAMLNRLTVVKHGQVSRLEHNEDALFDGIPNRACAVRYHSLCVDLGSSEDLKALAWADDGKENGRVVMALKHTSRPFWAVQYHPESVCTDGSGLQLVHNFWKLARGWRTEHRLQEIRDMTPFHHLLSNRWPLSSPVIRSTEGHICATVLSQRIAVPGLTVPKICEILGVYKANTDFVLLDSAAHPGRHAVIGCFHPKSSRIQYSIEEDSVTILQGSTSIHHHIGSTNIWKWLSDFMQSKKAIGGDDDIPFWGGLVGYLSYQLGVDNLRCDVNHRRHSGVHFPDVNLSFVERSIVVDVKRQEVVIQTILPADDAWLAHTTSTLKRSVDMTRDRLPSRPPSGTLANVTYPDKEWYISRIKQAQGYLYSGDSYELCFTAQTKIEMPKMPAPASQRSWELYKKLRTSNPAPYAAYLRLGPTIVISSSPERFLSYSRPPNQMLQLRPIKGTVKKGSGMNRERATEILSSPKEVGENLMIVDLIRHDLHGVVGTGVDVKKFCGIEEYETVWQLVSVIEGVSSKETDSGEEAGYDDAQLGWRVLQQSLPPGSMTGAPKKRSVELLDNLEEGDRGIYSGVLGYWCVGGRGDWSVIIRSCFKFDEEHSTCGECSEDENVDHDTWYVGAGGAITALSDPEAEWEEMVVKLQSVLRAFRTE